MACLDMLTREACTYFGTLVPPQLRVRTRISCCAAPTIAACAAFLEETRMKFAKAIKPDRKSGFLQRFGAVLHLGQPPPGPCLPRFPAPVAASRGRTWKTPDDQESQPPDARLAARLR
jgi:hypothetical protein